VANPDSPYFQSEIFSKLLVYLQTHTAKAKLKQVGRNGILIVDGIKTMEELLNFLKRMHEYVIVKTAG
jgi:transcription-repair coupling factor (superfamily II helicase)